MEKADPFVDGQPGVCADHGVFSPLAVGHIRDHSEHPYQQARMAEEMLALRFNPMH